MRDKNNSIKIIRQFAAYILPAFLIFSSSYALAQQVEGEAICQEPGATALTYGDHTVGCQISSGGDIDNLTFNGTIGERIRIIIHSTSSNAYDPRIELFDCGFVLMQETSCANNGCVAVIDTELTCTGSHAILVSDLGSNEPGAYNLQLERLTPPHDQDLLEYGSVTSDAISPGTDIDRFRFFGKVGTRVRAVIHSTTSNAYDPQIEILDPTGQLVDESSCPNNGCSFSTEFEPSADGFYSLFVSDLDFNESGGYNVVVHCIFGPCDSTGGGVPDPSPPSLSYDLPSSAAVSPDVDIESFSIDVVAGTTNRIAVHSNTSNAFDPVLEVYDSAGSLITSGACSNNGCTFVLELTPDNDERYTLLLSDSGGNEAGGFNINLQCLTGPCDSDADGVADFEDVEAEYVFYDGSFDNAVSPDVDMVPLFFNGIAGNVVRLAVHSTTSNAFDPQIEIFDPNGVLEASQFCTNNGCSFSIEFSLSMSGIYTAFVSDVGVNEAGGFNLNLQCIEGPCDSDADGLLDGDPTIVPLDITISDAISPGVDVDQYAFLGEIGKPLRITVDSTTSNAFDPQLELVFPGGAVTVNSCANNGCAFTFDFTPTETGLHNLIVSDLGTNESGGYNLLVSCLFANCSPPPPAPTDRDNCEWVENGPVVPDAGGNVQLDTDMDGYGNICDPDLDNSGVVNFGDYSLLTSAFLSVPGDIHWNADADFNGDGAVNFADISVFPQYFLKPPGPSALAP